MQSIKTQIDCEHCNNDQPTMRLINPWLQCMAKDLTGKWMLGCTPTFTITFYWPQHT